MLESRAVTCRSSQNTLQCRAATFIGLKKISAVVAKSRTELNSLCYIVQVSLQYSKNPYIRTLNFEDQAAIGSYLMIVNSSIRLLGS